MKNSEIRTLPHTYTKINSKWIKDLNVRSAAIKLIEVNTGRRPYNINRQHYFGGEFISESKINKSENKQMGQTETFLRIRETVDKMKRQSMEWEKGLVKDMTNRGLISKLYRQFIQHNTKKQTTQIKKMGRRTEQTFFFQVDNRHMKRF